MENIQIHFGEWVPQHENRSEVKCETHIIHTLSTQTWMHVDVCELNAEQVVFEMPLFILQRYKVI